MQTPYFSDASGQLRCVVPTRCCAGSDGSECRVGLHDKRARKSGPGFELWVARCHRHGLSFTLYPAGFVPYGRALLAPVDPQGRRVQPGEPQAEPSLDSTMWGAVADAAAAQRWPEQDEGHGSRRTQGRRLLWASLLLGLSSPPRQREAVASALGLAALDLHEAARAYGMAKTWRSRAKVVMGVVLQVLSGGGVDALLRAGAVAGLWGRPSRWDPGGLRLRALF